MWEAVTANNASMLKEMLTKGADLDPKVDTNTVDGYEQTALHVAARHDAFDCARTLIDAGADPCLRDKSGKTAGWRCAFGGRLKIFELLVQHSSDVATIPDDSGRTPMHTSAARGHISILKFLTEECGLQPDVLDKEVGIRLRATN